jgi:hypothetical protein
MFEFIKLLYEKICEIQVLCIESYLVEEKVEIHRNVITGTYYLRSPTRKVEFQTKEELVEYIERNYIVIKIIKV